MMAGEHHGRGRIRVEPSADRGHDPDHQHERAACSRNEMAPSPPSPPTASPQVRRRMADERFTRLDRADAVDDQHRHHEVGHHAPGDLAEAAQQRAEEAQLVLEEVLQRVEDQPDGGGDERPRQDLRQAPRGRRQARAQGRLLAGKALQGAEDQRGVEEDDDERAREIEGEAGPHRPPARRAAPYPSGGGRSRSSSRRTPRRRSPPSGRGRRCRRRSGRSSSLGCCLTTAQLAFAIPQPRPIR